MRTVRRCLAQHSISGAEAPLAPCRPGPRAAPRTPARRHRAQLVCSAVPPPARSWGPTAAAGSSCCSARTRRDVIHLFAAAWLACGSASSAAPVPKLSRQALEAFQAALSEQGDFEARDAAWTRVISLAPTSSPAWSNRGALRLQYGRWAQAEEDLRHAVLLEALPADERQQQQLQQRERERGDAAPLPASLLEQQPTAALEQVDASTLNNLGNAEVALGRLPQAMAHFQVAARAPEMWAVATANLALAACEAGDAERAVGVAQQLLRRDPAFLDARAALVAFLYSGGRVAEAEGEWTRLQDALGGVGGELYTRENAVARVRNRWPPRATAALDAFLRVSTEGTAVGYDGQLHTYSFRAQS